MPEKTDCIYYKKRRIESNSSHGTITGPTDIMKVPYCANPKIGNRLGKLSCEGCRYYKKKK